MQHDPTDPVAEYDRRAEELRVAEQEAVAAERQLEVALATRNAAMARETEARNAWSEARQNLVRVVAANRVPNHRATVDVEPTSEDDEPDPGEEDDDPDDALPVVEALPIPPRPDGIRPSFWNILILIPADGEIEVETLRERLGLGSTALANRVSKMKSEQLLESAGWGRYRLTRQSRALLQHLRLRLVQ